MENLKLFYFPTPNGKKVTIALEEMGIPYDLHMIDISKGEQFSEDYLKINPNSKIPALVDPEGNNGKPLAIMESGTILLYLAEKTKKFIPEDPIKRIKTLEWLFWQMGGVGPMFGQYAHFHFFASYDGDLSYPKERYKKEALRLSSVLDKQLERTEFVAGEQLTIADFSILPWILGAFDVKADNNANPKVEDFNNENFKNIVRWGSTMLDRTGTKKGLSI